MSAVSTTGYRAKRRDITRLLLARFGEKLFTRAQKRFERMSVDQVERHGARLGRLHYRLDAKHRNRTISNLQMVFPEWSESKVRETAFKVFEHFGRVAGDFLRSPVRTVEEVLESIDDVTGIEHFEAAKNGQLGVILVTAHFGNWERFLQWLTANGATMSVIARDPNQEGLQGRILRMREMTGAKVLATGNSARQALQCLRKNEFVGILADQNSDDAMVPFFGFPAGTVLGPAVMHLRTGASLLPAFCMRTGVGRYRIRFFPLVNVDGALDDRLEVMAQLNDRLEIVVREYPDQYLWMHDRWKAARRAGLLSASSDAANLE